MAVTRKAITADTDGALKVPFALTAAEREVVAAAAAGRTATPGAQGGTTPHPRVKQGWRGRHVRAAVVAALCTGDDTHVHPHGIDIAHARIDGVLDLRSVQLSAPLVFRECRIDRRVVLDDVKAPSVTIDGCVLPAGLSAARLETDGSLTLARSSVDAEIDVYDAKIGGDFDCTDLELTGIGPNAGLVAQGIEVGADVALLGCRVRDGGVQLAEGTIGRSVYADGADLHNTSTDPALSLVGSRVRGTLSLAPRKGHRFAAEGEVDLSRMRAALVDCRGALLDRGAAFAEGNALTLWGSAIDGDVWLGPYAEDRNDRPVLWRTTLHGHLDVTAMHIAGDLQLMGLTIINGVLTGERAEVAGIVQATPALDTQQRAVPGPDGAPMPFEASAVRLESSRLGGINCGGALIGGWDATAVSLSDATIGGEVQLNIWRGKSTDGSLVTLRTQLSGRLDLHGSRAARVSACGARFTAADGLALSLWGASLDGDLNLGAAQGDDDWPAMPTEITGDMELTAADIGGHLVLQGGLAHGAITARDIRVQGKVLLDSRLDSRPPLRTTIGGALALDGSHVGAVYLSAAIVIVAADAVAVDLSRSSVAGDVDLDTLAGPDGAVRCEITGAVVLVGAEIAGSIVAGGASVRASPRALQADRATVHGTVELDRARDGASVMQDATGRPVAFEAHGETSFFNAILKGQLTCRGGRFSNPGGDALVLYGADVAGDVLLDEVLDEVAAPERVPADTPPLRFDAAGRVRLFTARISHNLSFRGARVVHGTASTTAIDAANVDVTGYLALDRLDVTGFVDLRAVQAGTLSVESTLLRPGALVHDDALLDMSRARITGALVWRPTRCAGRVSVAHATAGELNDDIATWPDGAVDLGGFSYGALPAAESWQDRSAWLARQPVPVPQTYHQLAAYYRANGDDRAARKVAMERFNVRLRRPEDGRRGPAWAWRWFLRLTIGHGYEPWRTLPILLVVVAAVWGTTVLAANNGDMVATRSGVSATPAATDCSRTDYPCLQPLLYAADVVVPVLDFGQRTAWRQAGGFGHRVIPPLGTFLGWFLTTLVIAGFTGAVRRE